VDRTDNQLCYTQSLGPPLEGGLAEASPQVASKHLQSSVSVKGGATLCLGGTTCYPVPGHFAVVVNETVGRRESTISFLGKRFPLLGDRFPDKPKRLGVVLRCHNLLKSRASSNLPVPIGLP